MIGDQFGTERVIAVYMALLLFGASYNYLIAWLERKNYLHGYTAFAVAIGVAITLAGVAVISWRAAVITLGAFIASGIPMIAGSVARYVKEREQHLQQLRDEARG